MSVLVLHTSDSNQLSKLTPDVVVFTSYSLITKLPQKMKIPVQQEDNLGWCIKIKNLEEMLVIVMQKEQLRNDNAKNSQPFLAVDAFIATN